MDPELRQQAEDIYRRALAAGADTERARRVASLFLQQQRGDVPIGGDRSNLLAASVDRSFSDTSPAAGPIPEQRSRLGRAADALRTAGQGVFTLGDEAEGVVRAAGAMVPGGMSPREAYRAGIDAARAGVARVRENAPVTSLVLEGAGAAATMAGAARALPGLASRFTGSVPRAAAGAGLLGAAYGAGSEGDVGERAAAALTTGALGAAATPVFAGGARLLGSAMRNPLRTGAVAAGGGAAASQLDSEPGLADTAEDAAKVGVAVAGIPIAARRLGQSLPGLGRKLGERIFARAAEADLGPDMAGAVRERAAQAGPQRAAQMRAMDLGENLRGAANTAAGVPGSRARAEIPTFVRERSTGGAGPDRLQRVVRDVEEVAGQRAGQSPATRQTLEEARSRASNEAYGAAREAGALRTIPGTPAHRALEMLDAPEMRRYVNRAQNLWRQEENARRAAGEAVQEWNPRSARAVDLIKRAMDDHIAQLQRAGRGNQARVVTAQRRALLDAADPGLPRLVEARAQHAAASRDVEASYLGSGQKPPGSRRTFPRFTSSRYTPEEFAADWNALETPEQRTAALRSIVDDIRAGLDRPAQQGQSLTLLGRYDSGNQAAKLRTILGESGLGRLGGRQAVEEAFGQSERELSSRMNSRTAPKLTDISLLNWRAIVAEALEGVLPTLRMSGSAADRIAELNRLPPNELADVLEQIAQTAERRLQVGDAAAIAGGVALGRGLSGPGEAR